MKAATLDKQQHSRELTNHTNNVCNNGARATYNGKGHGKSYYSGHQSIIQQGRPIVICQLCGIYGHAAPTCQCVQFTANTLKPLYAQVMKISGSWTLGLLIALLLTLRISQCIQSMMVLLKFK